MPSPSIPPPSSYPRIFQTQHSHRAACPKKIENYTLGKSNGSLEKCRNESYYDKKKSSPACSPYYKGLTDWSLVINRERLSAGSSLGAKSDGSSISSGSKSYSILRVQEWTSWLTIFREEKPLQVQVKKTDAVSRHSRHAHASSSSSSSSSSLLMTKSTTTTTTLAEVLGFEINELRVGLIGNSDSLTGKEKPLRESDSDPPVLPPGAQTSLRQPVSSSSSSAQPSPPPVSWSLRVQMPQPASLLTGAESLVIPLQAPESSSPSAQPSPPHAQPSSSVSMLPREQPSQQGSSLSSTKQSLPPSQSPILSPPPPQPSLLQVTMLSPTQPPVELLLPSPSQPSVAQISPQPSRPPPSPPPLAETSPQQLQQSPSPPPRVQASTQSLQQSPSPPPPEQASPQTAGPPAEASPAKKFILDEGNTINARTERVFVWADKYRPTALEDFICNRSKALELQESAKAEDFGHFIFEGATGVGKRTMIWAFLREAYGRDRVLVREECRKFELKGEAECSIQVNMKISLQHVELNLSEAKGYEKQVIVELIQETTKRFSKKASKFDKDNCQVIVLYEADKLSTDSLLYIKWLLERHKGTNKVFFCCTDASKLQPIKCISTIVPLLPPSNQEIVEVLQFIAKQEGIELPQQLAEKIANNSKNNLRQAIRSLEATWKLSSSLEKDQEVMTGWEDDIANIGRNIIEVQSPRQLYLIRGKLQNLIEHNVSPEFIFKALVTELKKNLAEQFHAQINNMYEEYNNLARNRQEELVRRYKDPLKRNLYHFLRIEEFTAKFMSWYKATVINKKEA